ncbi:MAG: type II toxin-antitoxin system VapC family toxin [Myxococcota bacterium]|nr:type II toxin-antitoxin system VapC family toxin [Myxococcota bacterium]
MRNVYLDTTIPSLLATTKDDPASATRREITQAFWRWYPGRCRLFVSDIVVAELRAGAWPGREEALAAVADLTRLPVTDPVEAAAREYLRALVVPVTAGRDALHLACACVHGMQVLLTWNVRHLANPERTARLAGLNRRLGLATPAVRTPGSLLEGIDA